MSDHGGLERVITIGWNQRSRSPGTRILRAVLRPKITVERGADLAVADGLHREAHRFCFISRSVNFPVTYEASYIEV
jgi:organic hydroperoxide reductase OsmC/OhrA